MVLPSTLTQNKGFTFIELLISVAILAIILSLGLFIGFDFYKTFSFHSEKNTIVSVLQKARSQSLNNINQTRHGVRFENSSGLKYIIFECDSVNPQCDSYAEANIAKNILIDSSYGISINSPTLPFDVVFEQLNGDCIISSTFNCSDVISINSESQSYNININNRGRIDW